MGFGAQQWLHDNAFTLSPCTCLTNKLELHTVHHPAGETCGMTEDSPTELMDGDGVAKGECGPA